MQDTATAGPPSAGARAKAARAGGKVVPRGRWRRRRDWGQIVARVFCALFAVVGAVPLVAGLLLRLDPVQAWLAREVEGLVARELGVETEFTLDVRPWPLEVALRDVVIHSTDGGPDFVRARQIVARPRVFSLLAGKLDLGEVAIDAPEVRVVLRDGKLQNITFRTAEQPAQESASTELPLSAVSVTDGRVVLSVDGMRVAARGIDADVTLDDGPLELAFRATGAEVDRTYVDPARPEVDIADEDAICKLELRARVELPGPARAGGRPSPWGVLIRRLAVEGSADFDPDIGTRPSCHLESTDWRRVDLRLESLQADFRDGALASIDGRVKTFAPVALVHRLVPFDQASGMIFAQVDLHYEPEFDLPIVSGDIAGAGLGIGGTTLVDAFRGRLDIAGQEVAVSNLRASWGGGSGTAERAVVRPFERGIPVEVLGAAAGGVTMADILYEFGGHPRAWVGWTFEHATLPRFSGQLEPFALVGQIRSETSGFSVYDRPATDPGRQVVFATPPASITTTMRIEPMSISFEQSTVETARSRVRTSVRLGFTEALNIQVFDGSFVELDEISPLAGVTLAGRARIPRLEGEGTLMSPRLEGEVAVDDFVVGGFPLGKLETARASFDPALRLELAEGRLRQGVSLERLPEFSLDFGTPGSVVVHAHLDTETPEGLAASDLFHMTRFDLDPRVHEIQGVMRGRADVDFELGTARDRCGAGVLRVGASMELEAVRLAGEAFEGGSAHADIVWDDLAAGERGLRGEVYSAVLRTGPGTIVARASIQHGGRIEGDVIGSSIPLDRLEHYRSIFGSEDRVPTTEAPDKAGAVAAHASRVVPEASLSFAATVGGSLERLAAELSLELSRTRIGPSLLPASQVELSVVPSSEPPPGGEPTLCGNRKSPPSKPGATLTASSPGPPSTYRLRGQLFGEQVAFDDLEILERSHMLLSGNVRLRKLDLGALFNLVPGVAFSSEPPRGALSADVEIDELPFDDPGLAELRVVLHQVELERAGDKIVVDEVSDKLQLSGNALRLPRMRIAVALAKAAHGGQQLGVVLRGSGAIRDVRHGAGLALKLDLESTTLEALGLDLPGIQRAVGDLSGELMVGGTFSHPVLDGGADLAHGELRVVGFPLALEDIVARVDVKNGELVVRASARTGSGSMALDARAPMRGLSFETVDGRLSAQGVKLELGDGVRAVVDANLRASYDTRSSEPPHVYGGVALTSFSYGRPMALSLDLDQLTGRGKTQVDTYDPKRDAVTFQVDVTSPLPLRVNNNLLEVELCGVDGAAARSRDIFAGAEACAPARLTLVGSNQRFGARGNLRVRRGSKIFLQGHDFAVSEGTVRFDDETRIAPQLDINAWTEYQRYASSSQTSSSATTSTASSEGRWRIDMRAMGDADALRVNFSSDPPLSQDDIVLLLQIGMTRAELDRGLAGSLAQTVGLEALSAVTGADRAVRSIVPIDEFRFGSAYSSRTGRPEPTVTIGKRLSDALRATVTTGIGEGRDIRSNLEWKLSPQVSLQGSYDNVNDDSSSTFGNLGVDLRLHLEFE